MNFALEKFIPYGATERLGEFKTFHEANQALAKTTLTAPDIDADGGLFILGKIDGEWFALA